MRRISVLFLLLIFVNSFSQAQENKDVQSYFNQKQSISMKGQKLRRYWGMANLGVGVIGGVSSSGSQEYFHLMNGFFGGVNILMSSVSIRNIKGEDNTENLMKLELSQKDVERSHLYGLGFDAIVLGGGIALLNTNYESELEQQRAEGYGYSLILQGASLLVWDAAMYFIHRKNRKKKLDALMQRDAYYE